MKLRTFLWYVLFLGGAACLLSDPVVPWDVFKKSVLKDCAKFTGWCSQTKADYLMDFIHDTEPTLCVEIGAFGGATSYPIASALMYNHCGTLFAIDAWDNKAAIEGFEKYDPHYAWWKEVDLDLMYRLFIYRISEKKLHRWVRPVKKRSDQAVFLFSDASIDLLYIDGNFSKAGLLKDVLLYFPKVKNGGYIFLNDADKEEKKEAVKFLLDHAVFLKEKSLGNQCWVFQK